MSAIEYGPPVSLQQAKGVVEEAEQEAAGNSWDMVIAIVDSAGQLVLLHKMDNAQYGSIDVAQAKARTAVNFKRPSKEFEDAVADGGVNLRLLAMPGLYPLGGGLPLVSDNKIIGAIGVSGARADQDGQVALAGARVLEGGHEKYIK